MAEKISIYAFISSSEYVVLDGGMASELEHIINKSLHPTLWSAYCIIDSPDAVVNAHYSFLESGASIITTISYQASVEGFKRAGISEDVQQIFGKSVQLAVKAKERYLEKERVKRPVFIAASIGPFGAFLANGSEYSGDYVSNRTKKELLDYHRPRLDSLGNNELVDVLLFETFPSVIEADYLCELAQQIVPSKPIIVSFSCKDTKSLCSGETISEAVKKIEQYSQVMAVGVNCTKPAHITGLIKEIKSVTKKFIIVYPNRGENWDATAHKWIPHQSSEEPFFRQLIREWHKEGAKIIGGCCRMRPSDIAIVNTSLLNSPSNIPETRDN